MKAIHEVFGVAPDVLPDSYVNRGALDEEITKKIGRKTHIALRGESKCGKSWLRKKNIPNAIVVQCRLKTTVSDIYTDILSQLGIKLIIERHEKDTIKGSLHGSAGIGVSLIAKIRVKLGLERTEEEAVKYSMAGQDINDLRFITDLIKESERKVVIEDFHYLNIEQRNLFAFDLKTLWDYNCLFVIVGVWTKTNLLIFLNKDLAGRIEEISIHWDNKDLEKVIDKGCAVLNVFFSKEIKEAIIADCYGNVGIMQKLIINTLDKSGVEYQQDEKLLISDSKVMVSAAQEYADQLNTHYHKFASDVSSGIRKRNDSTGIYAHAMWVIIETSDEKLINGLHVDDIYRIANGRQSRIQKSNLKSILMKIEELQVDEDMRGLVIAYNEGVEEVSVVDRTLLFYRKYVRMNWPWAELVKEAGANSPPKQLSMDLDG